MTGRVVVIGLGNRFRRDDAVGVVTAAALEDLALPGVEVAYDVVDPLALLETWSGARLAILIDAAIAPAATVGSIRCCGVDELAVAAEGLSSHSIDIGRTHALGEALGRVPEALRIYAVAVADTGHGIGLTPHTQRAADRVVELVAAEIVRMPSVSACE